MGPVLTTQCERVRERGPEHRPSMTADALRRHSPLDGPRTMNELGNEAVGVKHRPGRCEAEKCTYCQHLATRGLRKTRRRDQYDHSFEPTEVTGWTFVG